MRNICVYIYVIRLYLPSHTFIHTHTFILLDVWFRRLYKTRCEISLLHNIKCTGKGQEKDYQSTERQSIFFNHTPCWYVRIHSYIHMYLTSSLPAREPLPTPCRLLFHPGRMAAGLTFRYQREIRLTENQRALQPSDEMVSLREH